MRRLILLGVAAAALFGLVPHAFAAGWALTVDAPLSYSFKDTNVNKPNPQGGGGVGQYDKQTTGDVSGSKVLLITPFHVGVGYEDYSVSQDITISNCPSGCSGKAKINFQIIDVVIDIPLKYLNIGLGYGSGNANVDIDLPAGAGGTLKVRNANVDQVFLTLGIPLGAHLDLHVGYHRVSVEEKDFVTGGSSQPDQLLVSGDMLSAGLRLNF